MAPRRWTYDRFFKTGLMTLAIAFVAIQFVPYGRDHVNPSTSREPVWPTQAIAELVRESCYDCHSNETFWPWYANVAPASWWVQNDVEEGREILNFSEMDRPQEGGQDAAAVVLSGEMPPWNYLLLHPDAELSDREKQQVAQALRNLFPPDDATGEDTS